MKFIWPESQKRVFLKWGNMASVPSSGGGSEGAGSAGGGGGGGGGWGGGGGVVGGGGGVGLLGVQGKGAGCDQEEECQAGAGGSHIENEFQFHNYRLCGSGLSTPCLLSRAVVTLITPDYRRNRFALPSVRVNLNIPRTVNCS